MNTHEKLKEMADLIGYDLFRTELIDWFLFTSDWPYRILDEREIIFTQEFMDKFRKYITNNHKTHEEWLICVEKTGKINWILSHLDDPTDYLYNLLFNK